MLDNKIKINRKIDKNKIIYILIFFSYSLLTVFVFVYALKFLSQALNSTFSPPQNSELETKYGGLRLDEYSLVANKLNLKNTNSNPSEMTTTQEEEPITDSGLATTSSLDTSVNATTTETASPTPVDTNLMASTSLTSGSNLIAQPTITITNSTLSSGLAANLKNELQKVGVAVSGLGSTRPALANTTIRVKASIDKRSDYFLKITKAVSLKYDFVIETLADTASEDIQIVIGSK